MPVLKVSIIGAGVMGMGIAQALSQQGFDKPKICDLEQSILKK